MIGELTATECRNSEPPSRLISCDEFKILKTAVSCQRHRPGFPSCKSVVPELYILIFVYLFQFVNKNVRKYSNLNHEVPWFHQRIIFWEVLCIDLVLINSRIVGIAVIYSDNQSVE